MLSLYSLCDSHSGSKVYVIAKLYEDAILAGQKCVNWRVFYAMITCVYHPTPGLKPG